ncbi:MAG TPA: LD-carboxypeptidase [Candidatus Moranbacteria bacterium]|nr:LD-carboxypeptidase [Candidatus Moranbacteria bacterium]
MKPKKIKKGAHIRIIAPVRSLGLLSEDTKSLAIRKLEEYGFKLSFGRHVSEMDEFNSSSIDSRIRDLHDAFLDKDVDAILTVIGGYNSNQLLKYIDYELIKKNPKIICGFSDVTALGNAITSKTGLITYMGPHFSSWAMQKGFEYSLEGFEKCCMKDESFELLTSKEWSDDPWYLDQDKREFIPNDGYWILNPGNALGRTIGGNLCTFKLLCGTDFMQSMEDSILLLEDDSESMPHHFDRELQSLIHQNDFNGVKGILIGRFQKDTQMRKELLHKIIKGKKELKNIPIIANVDFGHTTPLATIPIGGIVQISVIGDEAKIKIIEH